MFMFFNRNKAEEDVSNANSEYDILGMLQKISGQGVIVADSLVLEEVGITIYADIIKIDTQVVQIVFQLHHEWVEDALFESVAGTGINRKDSVNNACSNFYVNVLSVFLHALEHKEFDTTLVNTIFQEHQFYVYKSEINGVGKREGIIKEDFWSMLEAQIAKRLGVQKIYWVKVFIAKSNHNIVGEVRINGSLSKELTDIMCDYASNWDCLGNYHSQKQCFLLVQDDRTCEKSDFTNQEIRECTKKAIKLFEKCKTKEDYKKMQQKLTRICKDDSLAMEMIGFIPELYCCKLFPKVGFGEELYLIQKDKPTLTLYQTQVQSFAIIESVVNKHFKDTTQQEEAIRNVVTFSANYRAIQQALEEGDLPESLFILGIGYYVLAEYTLR